MAQQIGGISNWQNVKCIQWLIQHEKTLSVALLNDY